MKTKWMMIPALIALLLAALFGCGAPSGSDGEGWQPGDYANNPTLIAAQKCSDTVIRLSFSAPVRPAVKEAWKRVSIGDLSAASMRLLDLRKDATFHLCATVIEFTFPSPVEGTEVRISAGEGENTGRALTGVFCGGHGEGLYAPLGEEDAPYAAVSVTEEERILPDVPAAMVAATRESEDTVLAFFSKPVRMIKAWEACGFFADGPDPAPGEGNSWQEYIKSASAVDPQETDGQVFSEVWRITVKSPSALGARFAAGTVFLRISENDERAGEEYVSDWNNEDIGRVVSAQDGTPVEADYTAGWDVAYVPVQTDPVWLPPLP